ncbi:MAG: carbohydrate ABC transporter permease [Trueperaceae bacterium]
MRHHRLAPLSFLLLPLGLYLVWVIYPTFATMALAFTNWDGISPTYDWVGLANFERLFADRVFWLSLGNNLRWVAVFVTIPLAMGLALALALNRNVRFDRFLKVAYYLPMVLAFVVIGLMWAWIYHPRQGLLNNTLFHLYGFAQSLGFDVNPLAARRIGWLGDPNLAMGSIIAAATWQHVGYVMILYLAGLKTVNTELLDAGQVDGASPWQLFRYITFPQLAPVTTIVLVITVIQSLRAFDLVYVMTRGGPFNSSNVLANFMYIEAFMNYNMGYGAAIAVVLFLISVGFIAAYLYRVVQEEER